MEKPFIHNGDIMKITITLDWLLEAFKAVDRASYACGGISQHSDGDEAVSKLAKKLILMDIEDVKKEAR